MPVAKFYSKDTVRQVDRRPDPTLMAIFREILDKRLPNHLIDPTLPEPIILKSGGVLRELIRIVNLCCDRAMQQLRRQIRQQQFDQPQIVITPAILESVLTDLQISYSESLGQKDFTLLLRIYQEFKPEDSENQRFLDLLHGLYILEYRNRVQWFDLNPIVQDLLIQEGVLHGATTG
jgi:hypothetical protein